MPAHYLLPCSCGNKVRVDVGQAGGQVACTCGKTLAVPTFRGLKQLEVAPPQASDAVDTRRWPPLYAGMFSIGLLVTLLSLIVIAVSLVQYASIADVLEDQSPHIFKFESDQIDKMPVDQSLDLWRDLRDKGPGDPVDAPWVVAKQQADRLWQFIRIAGILALVGLSLCIIPIVLRSRRA